MAKESIKFQEEEVNSLKEIQLEMDQVIVGFGQVAINRESLKDQENHLKTQLSQLKTKEQTLAQTLTNKYGKGTFNLENNEFIPVD
jgi:CRISPR/Cas system CMR-associated protein Cmr5 small subunit